VRGKCGDLIDKFLLQMVGDNGCFSTPGGPIAIACDRRCQVAAYWISVRDLLPFFQKRKVLALDGPLI